jgi:hypothetical protein
MLVSDDVRTETTGKLIVIGLYGFDIITTKMPLAMPLALTAAIGIEGAGTFQMSGKLKHSASGEELLTFGAKGDVTDSGMIYVPFKFPIVHFKETGRYEVSLAVEGQQEILIESFQVKLAPEKNKVL